MTASQDAMETPAADVRLVGVEKRYGQVVAVHHLDLEIPRGSFFSLLGPSGCGKTTTLRLIAGFEPTDRGEIYIRDQRVTALPAYKRNFGMVFQNYALFPHLSVAKNISFGLEMRQVSKKEIGRRVDEALELVKLGGYGERYPRQLSGGQQQRVALARAIVFQPDVLLLDEPLGALDKMLREEMQVELRQLQRRLDTTTVFVTHDQEEALTMSDTVAVMRDGRIEQAGAPRDIYDRPRTEFVATFLGASNLIDGVVREANGSRLVVDAADDLLTVLAQGPRPGDRVRLGLRPERVRLAVGDGGRVRAEVREVVYRGAQTHLYMARHGQPFMAFLANASAAVQPVAPGQTIAFDWDDESLVLLKAVAG